MNMFWSCQNGTSFIWSNRIGTDGGYSVGTHRGRIRLSFLPKFGFLDPRKSDKSRDVITEGSGHLPRVFYVQSKRVLLLDCIPSALKQVCNPIESVRREICFGREASSKTQKRRMY